MKKQFLVLCLLALSTSGCGKMMSFVGLDRGETVAPAARPQAMTLSEPVRTVQPAPFAADSGSWEKNLARDIPYFNMSPLPVPVYSDAAFTQKVGTLAPGEGGFIETCSDLEPVCRIAYAGTDSGWVRMDRMGGLTN